MQLQQGKQVAKFNLLRKCGLLAHTSAAFLKSCCTEKLFSLPAARILQPLSISSNILAIRPAEIVHSPDKMPVLLPVP